MLFELIETVIDVLTGNGTGKSGASGHSDEVLDKTPNCNNCRTYYIARIEKHQQTTSATILCNYCSRAEGKEIPVSLDSSEKVFKRFSNFSPFLGLQDKKDLLQQLTQ